MGSSQQFRGKWLGQCVLGIRFSKRELGLGNASEVRVSGLGFMFRAAAVSGFVRRR